MTRLSLFSGGIIIFTWIVTMGYLLHNHYFQPEQPTTFSSESIFGSVEAVRKWRDVKEYMLIKQDGRVVGASITDIRQESSPDSDLTYSANFSVAVKLSPLLPHIKLKGSSKLDHKLHIQNFHAVADAGPAKFKATGAVVEDLLYLQIANPGGTTRRRMRLQGPISVAEAVRPALGSQVDIVPGNRLSTPVIDPLTGANRGTLTIVIKDLEDITVGGETVKAYRVESSLQDIKNVMWVDAYGQTLKRNLVGNFTMERTSYDEAMAAAPGIAEPLDIPDLPLQEFATVPITTDYDNLNGGQNSAVSTLRELIQ